MSILHKIWKKIILRRFIAKHGLTDVFCRQANRVYTIFQGNYGKDVYVEDITSDGIQKIVLVKEKMDKENYEMIANVQVRKASWVIKTIKKNGKIERRILFTELNPKELSALPKPK